jgi:hypothetical protein
MQPKTQIISYFTITYVLDNYLQLCLVAKNWHLAWRLALAKAALHIFRATKDEKHGVSVKFTLKHFL